MHNLASRLARPAETEDFSDTQGRKFTELSDLIKQVLYSASARIALPLLQLPLKSTEYKRWIETVNAD